MVKSKKQMFMIIGVFALILILGTTTYAFFNYTRTGGANTFSVGRIYFTTNQTETINLTNAFPIERSAIDTDTDNVDEVVIEIEGDTDYSEGIEYLVSSVDSSIYTSTGKLVPISIDVTVTDLGTASPTYFTARDNTNTSIYKKLVGNALVGDQMLLVGYIAPNATLGTASGIDGSITIKAFFDKDVIAISDTYDGTESDLNGTTNEWADGRTVLTTTEWNSLSSTGISFKIKVEANEGIWVNQPLDDIVRVKNLDTTTYQPIMDNVSSTYVSASTGIDFGAISSDTNGKGVYMHAGTENDAYPILYYRGDITDNNVIYAYKCWKVLRTTDTGGVKLIYNGDPTADEVSSPSTMVSSVGFEYDSSNNSWNSTITSTSVTSSSPNEISFTVPSGNGYRLDVTGTTATSGGVTGTLYKNGTAVTGYGGGGGNTFSVSYDYGYLAETDVVKVTFYIASGDVTPDNPTIKVKMMKLDLSSGATCNNSGDDTLALSNGSRTSPFSDTNLYESPAYVGYKWGTVYEKKTKNTNLSMTFGSGFTYSNGQYMLTDTAIGLSDNRHYTFFEFGPGNRIYYVFHRALSNYYYIELTNGKSVDDALAEMQENTTFSRIISHVNSWYWKYMTAYTGNIEDTIYCNDRSLPMNNHGWNPNGGNIYTSLLYGPYIRVSYNVSTNPWANQPSLQCKNKNDSFTVNNGNGNKTLAFPVGLITADEIVFAGGARGVQNESFYLNAGAWYWTMSPASYNPETWAQVFIVANNGGLSNSYPGSSDGVRPVISVKPGQPVASGTGTVTDPYVIE